MTFFFAALSVRDTAVMISPSFLVFFAKRTAISSFLIISLLTSALFFDPLRARLAVFVTGMSLIKILNQKLKIYYGC